MLERVERGEFPSAAKTNARIDLANRIVTPGAAQEAQYGEGGTTFSGPPKTLMHLFVLVNEIWYPDEPGAPTPPDLDSQPDCPYTIGAQRVFLDRTINEYTEEEISKDYVLYLPTYWKDHQQDIVNDELPDGAGALAILAPKPYGIGDRVVGYFDEEATRWNIICRPKDIMRIECGPYDYVPGSASVIAELLDYPNNPYATIYVPANQQTGIARHGQGDQNPAAGTQGYAVYSPERLRWELLCWSELLCMAAKVSESGGIARGNLGDVVIWWVDWDNRTGPLISSGITVSARNWNGPTATDGWNVNIYYDRTQQQALIITFDQNDVNP